MAQNKQTTDDRLVLALYSNDRLVRQQVTMALGDHLPGGLGDVRIDEFATADALMEALHSGGKTPFSCIILDAETTPLGGMGLGYQIKDEIKQAPPMVLMVARPQDAWLATWSRANAVVPLPIDPLTLPDAVASVIRANQAGTLDDTSIVPGAASRH